jgi:hypothetical protein
MHRQAAIRKLDRVGYPHLFGRVSTDLGIRCASTCMQRAMRDI